MGKNIKNPNTPELWNRRIFNENQALLHSPIYVDKINRVFKYLKIHKGKFLDIGLGAGNLENNIKKTKLKLELYGVDISPNAILNAKKQLGRNFYVANVLDLPFKSYFFDTVAILDVLEHIYEDEALMALKEINRVMKKNGSLVVSVPLNEGLKELDKNGKNYNMHQREYTLQTLSKELLSSGFIIQNSEFLYAFKKFYWIKSFVVKFIHGYRKPNLLIVYSKKK